MFYMTRDMYTLSEPSMVVPEELVFDAAVEGKALS